MTATNSALGSTTLSASALASVTNATLTDTCTLVSRELARDGQGTFSEVWATVALDVPCLLEKPVKDAERVIGGILQSVTQFSLRLPVGTVLEPTYAAVKDAQLYEIVDDDQGLTSPLYLTAIVMRMKNAPIS